MWYFIFRSSDIDEENRIEPLVSNDFALSKATRLTKMFFGNHQSPQSTSINSTGFEVFYTFLHDGISKTAILLISCEAFYLSILIFD